MENLINGLKNNRAFAFSSLLVLLLLGIARAAPWIAPYDPLEAVMKNAYLPPSGEHLLARISWAEIILAVFCMGPAIRSAVC